MPKDLSTLAAVPTMSELSDPGATSMTDIGAQPEEEDAEEVHEEGPERLEDDPEGAEEAEELLKSAANTPQDEWREELEFISLTAEQAAHILDKVMSTGKYEETYRMGGLRFRLRTRTTVDADRTIEILQAQKPDVSGVYAHIISRVNLAASLVSYGDNTFPHTAPSPENRVDLDKEWRQRYAFCASLPGPAFYALSSVLQRFDQKVSLACDARSLENF